MTKNLKKPVKLPVLRHFTDDELPPFIDHAKLHTHPDYRTVCYTDEVKYAAEAAKVPWLIDLIAYHQEDNTRIAREKFQGWRLTVTAARRTTVHFTDRKGLPVFHIPLGVRTDCPFKEIVFCVHDGVIVLGQMAGVAFG